MKKQTILSSILGIALLTLTACNNNDENAIENGKVDVAQGIEFNKSAKTRCDANVKRKVTFLCKTKSDKTNTRTGK